VSEGNDREIVLLYLSPYNFLGHSVVVYVRDNKNLRYPLYYIILLLFAQHNNDIPIHPLIHVSVMTDNELCECYIYYNMYNILLLYSRTRPNSSLTFDNRSRIVLDAYGTIIILLHNICDVIIVNILYSIRFQIFDGLFFHQFQYNIVTRLISIL